MKKDADAKFESVFIQAKGTHNHKKAAKEEESIAEKGKKQKKKIVFNVFEMLNDDDEN